MADARFFLLAGFFAALVLQRRGAGPFACDRLIRTGAVLGLAHRSLKTGRAWVDCLIELSYPLYILHLVPALMLRGWFISLGMLQVVAIPLNVVAPFFISVTGYYVLIKYTPLK